MGFPITGQHYNLVSLAFYVGFLIWEFPTVYISQKLPVAKYLGSYHVVLKSDQLLTRFYACRMQRCHMGHNTYATGIHDFVRGFLRFAFPSWNVRVLRSPDFDSHNLDVLQEG